MGILDFREICSANSTHSSVVNSPIGISNYPDDFELFCQEFFGLVKRFRIFRTVSRGPDLGIDLGVEETTPDGTIRWLVSCKHYSHSGSSISEESDRGIVETVGSWDCQGFIPFYTGVPSTKLSQHISGAEKFIKVERYYKERIERELLDSSIGTVLASRYFPKSMTNHYKNIISPATDYSEKDIQTEGNTVFLRETHTDIEISGCHNQHGIKEVLKSANIIANISKHKPYFDQAVNDLINLHPEMFVRINDRYEPTWDIMSFFTQPHYLHKAYFIFSAWSFWDFRKANNMFADFMIIHADKTLRNIEKFEEYKKTKMYKDDHYRILQNSLMTLGLLGKMLPDEERDIIARLFAFTVTIPRTTT